MINLLYAQSGTDIIISSLDKIEQNKDFNGIVLIAKDGNPILTRSIGYANFEESIPVDLNTPIHIASISKSFTTMALFILQERGLLDFNDKVFKYIPDFPYQKITIRQLMTSSSGPKRLYNKAVDDNNVVTITSMMGYFETVQPKLAFTPGDEFLSSVAGYTVLAAVIEKVTSESFEQFLIKEIFKPLQFENTFLLSLANKEYPRALNYSNNEKPKDWFAGSYPGGVSIYSSASDLLKWDQALYTNKLISYKLLDQYFEKIKMNDGSASNLTLGSWMYWKGNENQIFKNGQWVANSSTLWRDTKTRTTVIILTNKENKVSKFDLMDMILPALGY
ncbi:serine hydrolase domain-containing protein [Marinigracilibium pacificum]|nr:serine hydrolase domain-containing protein [Marinigracilibium pacificum]